MTEEQKSALRRQVEAATADKQRFFIDHGMIHDRKTGKHVTTAPDDETWNGGTITETCALLNSLHRNGVLHCLEIIQKEIDGAEETLASPNLTEAARREAKCWHDGVFFAAKNIREKVLNDDTAIPDLLAETEEKDRTIATLRARIAELEGAKNSAYTERNLLVAALSRLSVLERATTLAIDVWFDNAVQDTGWTPNAGDRERMRAVVAALLAAKIEGK